MKNKLVTKEILALQAEAAEARNLAETLSDTKSVADLERYASALEVEATLLFNVSVEGSPLRDEGKARLAARRAKHA